MKQSIGRRRICYCCAPDVYPGEQAIAIFDPRVVDRALRLARAGLGHDSIAPLAYRVEPMPGPHGRYLRWRWRLWGCWFATGPPPRLVAEVR